MTTKTKARFPAWTALAVVAACASSCGAAREQPLVASFELGPKELGRAVLLRFPEVLTPESTRWPSDAAPVAVDLSAERGAVVDLSAEAWLAGASVKVRPASVRFEDGDTAFERYELWAAPETATSLDDPSAVLLGTSAPSSQGAATVLGWTEDGPRWFAQAVAGGLPEQGGVQRFVLFLRGKTRVSLAPGDVLPAAPVDGAATRVVVEIELQVGP